MSDRVLRFQDSEVKIRTIIYLAETLWSRGQDEQAARPLFLKADELIRAVRIAKVDSPVAGETNRDAAAVSPNVLLNLKSLLVQKLSVYDVSLGQRLVREYGLDTDSSWEIASLNNYEVSELIRRGQLVSATKYLQSKIDDNLLGMKALLGFLNILVALRAQDAQAADRLFIEAILKMSGQPNVTANDVLIIGNYLFAGRGWVANPLVDIRIVGSSPIQLGDVLLRADLRQVRPGISNTTARTYIGTATQVLERASYDPEEMKRRAAAAYLLLPHARAFAPEFVSQLSGIQSRAGIDFSKQTRTNPLPLTPNGKLDLEALLESVDAIPSSKLRDQHVLKTVRLLYFRGDLEAALTVAEKVSDLTSRNELAGLITFAQGAKSLGAGQTEIAQKSLNKVTTTLQRCLLRFGLAQQFLLQHDKPAAEALLNEAIEDIRDHGDELQKPYLILSSVEMLASFNLRAATGRLRDAIKAFNALESPRKARPGPIFWETIRLGDSSESFPLSVSGVNYATIGLTMRSLSSDPQGVKAALFEMKDEGMLSEGILALAVSLLLK
jgi:tetratricopeptide (TPR) repeat protein